MNNFEIYENFSNGPAPAPACPNNCDYSNYIKKDEFIELSRKLRSSQNARSTLSDTIRILKNTNSNLQTQIARKNTQTSLNLQSNKLIKNDCPSQGFISLEDNNKLLKLQKNENEKNLIKLKVLKLNSDKIYANLNKSESNNIILKKTIDKIKKDLKFYKFPGFWITTIILISIFSTVIYFILNSSKSNSIEI